MNPLFKSLNQQQEEAAKTLEGPVLVLAGAGSGKTRVVTTRIVHLIENGISPSAILGLTFTNKAAGEMRERVCKMTNHIVLICTFHSLGARILRESINALGYPNDFTIYDEEDAEKLLKVCLSELNITNKKLDAKSFKHLISKAKNILKNPDEIERSNHPSEIEELLPAVYALYQKKLKLCHAVDFDDLLFLTVKLFEEHPSILARYQNRWPFVLIDEYQDTNETQYKMIHLLVNKSNNIFVVGDPDQSIYSWRGANIKNILNFEHDYPGAKVIRLEQNYRSHTHILDAANSLIQFNTNRFEKNLWSDLGPGEKIKLYVSEDETSEADFVAKQVLHHTSKDNTPLKEMVVFYRTNAQSRIFEDRLAYEGISYVIVGGISFYQRREIKDVLAFLRIAHSGADFISFARTINIPKRGLGEATIDKIRLGATEEGMTILGYCIALLNEIPLKHPFKLTAKQKEGLSEYLKVIIDLREISKQGSIKETVIGAIEKTGYLTYLKQDPESFSDRKENLDELITKSVEWEKLNPNPTLSSFLEELSLKSNLDEVDPSIDRLNLMTIHNGKGLEFNTVFLVGLEEDLFPHVNSKESLPQLEEERRLCYVGMTRAKDHLYISHCYTRYLWGNLRMQKPSRFLDEIPQEHCEKFKAKRIIPDSSLKNYVPYKAPQPIEKKQLVGSQENFAVGDTVFHKEFGIGQIQDTSEGSLGLTYKIFFTKDNSTKTLVGKYAPLSRL